jgi:signal transduction histidine kinase
VANGTLEMDALEAREADAAPGSCDAATRAARARHERRASERDELAALIAHDLKNPLSSIRFGAELLLHDPATPDRVRALAEQIIASTDGALTLVAAYLEPVGLRGNATLQRTAIDAELRGAFARARGAAIHASVELRAAKLEPIEGCIAPTPFARGLDHLVAALLERAPSGSAFSMTLERVADRGIASFASAAPAPTREQEQRILRDYARLRAGRAPEAATRLAQARFALESSGAELYRVPAAHGTRYRLEFTALE